MGKNKQIEKSYELLLESIRTMEDFVFVKDLDFKYVAVSDTFARMIGKSSVDEVIGKTDFDIFKNKELAESYRKSDEQLVSDNKECFCKSGGKTIENDRFAVSTKVLVKDKDGQNLGILGYSKDETNLLVESKRFHQELKFLSTLSETDYFSVVIDLDEWELISKNFNTDYGEDFTADMDLDSLLKSAVKTVTPECGEAYVFYSNFSYAYISNIYCSGRSRLAMEYPHTFWNGESHWMKDEIHIRVNPEDGHLYVVLVVHNLGMDRKTFLELRRQAETDGLTGLYNRNYAMKKIDNFLKNEGKDRSHAFLILDIDNFKSLNDTHGHQAGDDFLRSLAMIMKTSIRGSDIIGRLGGDEFFALMKNLQDEEIIYNKATDILNKIRFICADYTDLDVSASIGICSYPRDGETINELYANADIALYEAKNNSKNQVKLFKGKKSKDE